MLKNYQNYFSLSHRVAVYIPSTQNVDKPISDESFKKRLQASSRVLAGLFGGATSSEALGSYLSSDGKLISERVGIVYAYASSDALRAGGYDKLLAHAQELARLYGQESIMLELDKKAYFINSNRKEVSC